jgi:HD superfamily phosphohydrolase
MSSAPSYGATRLATLNAQDLKCDRYFGPADQLSVTIERFGPGGVPTPITPTLTEAKIADRGFVVPVEVQQSLNRVSQLGLKEMWLGGSPGHHTRWEHTRGCFTVGLLWLEALMESKAIPGHLLKWPLDTNDRTAAILGTALLLHDYGHLPFAHLMEEVLSSINWLPKSRTQGLEAAVLEFRLRQRELNECWTWLSGVSGQGTKGKQRALRSTESTKLIEELILGTSGHMWLQTLVNSVIDADKIDYVRFDSDFLTDLAYPVRARLLQNRPQQWLAEFLSEQSINHAGLVCLGGRSAVAAVDLWRERMFLYDRLYLSPELRVPDRMAFEIVQRFVIYSTMSKSFNGGSRTYFPDRLAGTPDCAPDQLLRLKYESVRETMIGMLKNINTSDLELDLLKRMKDELVAQKSLDSGYKQMLVVCLTELTKLKTKGPESHFNLRRLLETSLVRTPLILSRRDFNKAQRVLRPLQHYYYREVLIDIVKLPRVLSGPRLVGSDHTSHWVLVPNGPIHSWGRGQAATRLLHDDLVEDIEIPNCRVVVVAPGDSKSARAAYIWDRVRSSLIEENIATLEDLH